MPLRAFKFKIYKRKGPQSKNQKEEGLIVKRAFKLKVKEERASM